MVIYKTLQVVFYAKLQHCNFVVIALFSMSLYIYNFCAKLFQITIFY